MRTLEPYENLRAADYPIPELSRGLVLALLARHPHVNPTPGESSSSIMYRAGRRSVIDELLQEFARQQAPTAAGVTVKDHGHIR